MQKRSSIVGGLILIALGVVFLLLQAFPGLAGVLDLTRQWPLFIVAVGGFFLLGALLGAAPLAIPGMIIGGIGSILYYQNLTGNWESWAYAWALIPGFVGLGMIIMGWLDAENRGAVSAGGRLLVVSLVMFVVFGAFFGMLGFTGQLWPLVLIGLGVWLLFRNRRRRAGTAETVEAPAEKAQKFDE